MTGRLIAFMTKVLSDPEKGHFSAKRIRKRKSGWSVFTLLMAVIYTTGMKK